MENHPVKLVLEKPRRWARIHVLLRLGLLLALAVIGAPLGYLYGVLYVVLPVVAALIVSQQGAAAYLTVTGPRIVRAMYWWNAAVAYLLLLTDRVPGDLRTQGPEGNHLQFDVAVGGAPTVGTALLRWLTSLPEFIALAVLWWIAGIVLLIAAITVLLVERVPDFALSYLEYLLVFQARLLAYHASLVETHALWSEPGERTTVGV